MGFWTDSFFVAAYVSLVLALVFYNLYYITRLREANHELRVKYAISRNKLKVCTESMASLRNDYRDKVEQIGRYYIRFRQLLDLDEENKVLKEEIRSLRLRINEYDEAVPAMNELFAANSNFFREIVSKHDDGPLESEEGRIVTVQSLEALNALSSFNIQLSDLMTKLSIKG